MPDEARIYIESENVLVSTNKISINGDVYDPTQLNSVKMQSAPTVLSFLRLFGMLAGLAPLGAGLWFGGAYVFWGLDYAIWQFSSPPGLALLAGMTVLSVALIGGVSVSKRAYDQSEVKYLVQVGIADEKVTVLRTSDQKYAERVRTAIGNAIAS